MPNRDKSLVRGIQVDSHQLQPKTQGLLYTFCCQQRLDKFQQNSIQYIYRC